MKKLFALLFLLTSVYFVSAQIQKGGCQDFKNYNTMVKDKTTLTEKEFDVPIIVYAKDEKQAKYNLKVEILRDLTGNTVYLNNPRVDSVLAEFAGEVIFLVAGEYETFKTKKKDRDKGNYAALAYRIKYNKELIEYVTYHINTFIKYSVVFIINPYIAEYGDISTKELYNMSLNTMKTNFLQPKYKFDNVIEDRMLEKAKLEPKPANYNPAQGFQTYKTGNKYLDYVTAISNNANRSRQVDVIYSVDSITIYKIPNTSKRVVTFQIIGYSVNTATMILMYQSQDTVEVGNDYDAVDIAMKKVFARDIDKYMYDVAKRFSSYVRDGVLFSVKIASNLMDQTKEIRLETSMLDCKLFAEASINPGEWRNLGNSIGKTYEGRSYLLDRLRLKLVIFDLLEGAGLKDFVIDIQGTDYVVTKKTN